MRKLMMLLLMAAAARAQYSTSAVGSSTAAAEINSKPAFQLSAGACNTLAGTAGKDFCFDTTNHLWYHCATTGSPCTWAQVIDAGGSFSNPSWITALAYSKLTGVPAFARTDTANTWTTGAQDFSAATHLRVPNAAGYTPTLNGHFGYDTTSNLFKGYVGAAVKTFAFLDSNITGNASTSSAFDHTPSLCTGGLVATGVLANGNATGCTSTGGGGGITGLTATKFPKASNSTTIVDSNLTENADGSDNAGKALTWAAANKPTFNIGGTSTCDFSQSNVCEIDFGAGDTTLALSNPHGSGPYVLRSCQDSVGGRSYTAFPGTAVGLIQPDRTGGVTNCTEQPMTYDGTNYKGGTSAVPGSAWHGVTSPEGTAPGSPVCLSGTDVLYADSTAHKWKVCNNAGAAELMLIPSVLSGAIAVDAAGVVTLASATVGTSQLVANAVTSAKMAVVNTRRTACLNFGANNAAAVMVDGDLGPQSRQYFINAPGTLVEMEVAGDGGTPNIILGRSRAGTIVNLTSAALATASSGGIACSSAAGGTGLDGTTTCGSTLQNTALAAGDWITAVSGTAGGVAKQMSACFTWTVN